MNGKSKTLGWTNEHFAQAKLVMETHVRENVPPDTRDMVVDVDLKGGAAVQQYWVYIYDIASDEPQGDGFGLSFDGTHARFAAHIGSAYVLYCIIEETPGRHWRLPCPIRQWPTPKIRARRSH